MFKENIIDDRYTQLKLKKKKIAEKRNKFECIISILISGVNDEFTLLLIFCWL